MNIKRQPSIKVGDVFTHDTYGDYIVIDYINSRNVVVFFSRTGYINRTSSFEIKQNEVRDHTQIRIHGVGINDADYKVIEKERKGRGSLNKSKCPFWTKWSSMLGRCYSGSYTAYDEVFVCSEWLTFTNFKSWMETQDWEGKHLDKDLLGDGTLYSPDNCIFITQKLNSFLARSNQQYVGRKHSYGKYQSDCIDPFSGLRLHLGTFKTLEEAHLAWKAKKHEHACKLADIQDDLKVAEALRRKFL